MPKNKPEKNSFIDPGMKLVQLAGELVESASVPTFLLFAQKKVSNCPAGRSRLGRDCCVGNLA